MSVIMFWVGFIIFAILARTSEQYQLIEIHRADKTGCNVTSNITTPNIDCDRRNIVIAHGWQESIDVVSYKMLMEKLSARNYSVFFVNWSKIASNPIYPLVSVKSVGTCLGAYLQDTLYQKCQKPYVHLLGHSLGAHVVGNAGRLLKNGNLTVDVITGLDPAGPDYYLDPDNSSLEPTDANLVVQLSTNRYVFGTALKLGNVVFYANGGSSQPGCPFDGDKTTNVLFCSHQRSVSYTIEAVDSDRFVARRCRESRGVFEAKDGGDSVVYNLDVPTNTRGSYCFDTNKKSPYATG